MSLKTITLLASLTKKSDIKLIEGECIGVDRGAYFAFHHQIPLLLAIGDFDSLSHETETKLQAYYRLKWIKLPTNKDVSDTEYAMQYALNKGYKRIVILGAIGKRVDHMLAILHLMYRYQNIDIILKDKHHYMRMLSKGVHTLSSAYFYLSFFAYEKTKISATNVKYPLHEKIIDQSDTVGLSNECLDHTKTVEVSITEGVALVVQTNKF
jgi:thiamine pyrophosphokinase